MTRKKNKSARVRAHDSGLVAEKLAALYLMLKGYRILAMRYKTGMGEIDIIAVKRGMLAAIEVKARAGYADAVEAVRPHAQARIQNALHHFVMCHPRYAAKDQRFDVITVTREGIWKLRITHLDNAWQGRT